ncbi:GGDEF domain-containing protein [Pelagibacterium lentulum]|uniref:diguanylate cyclase n=2 Tax=Pelagibacterium lentulum TaxID=2029865 RepID=A0A916RFE4_9HYPH|nr:sensor domain-containing diguanylate cyclase [Pelagibacterium lentulum]GGA54533.1 GGDEF domain-containing protein [Pelagibacterium lentulum]
MMDALTDEEGRLCAIYRYGIPQTDMSEAMDRIAKVAMAATGTPIAAVSIIDRQQQIFMALRGAQSGPIPREESLCAMMIGKRRPLIVADTHEQDHFSKARLVKDQPHVRAYLGVPIISPDGYHLGTVSIADVEPRMFSEANVTALVNLAALAMEHISTHQPDAFDFATGALTRHRFQANVEREFARAKRYERPATLVFLDIDKFNEINTAIGHEMGDEVLKAVANRCKEVTRVCDSFGRIGGEAFGLLLPETMPYEASQCAERIREDINKLRFRTEKGVLSITASFGVAALTRELNSAMQWFAQADIAMFGAKRAGRNCVVFAPPLDAEDAQPSEGQAAAGGARANIH